MAEDSRLAILNVEYKEKKADFSAFGKIELCATIQQMRNSTSFQTRHIVHMDLYLIYGYRSIFVDIACELGSRTVHKKVYPKKYESVILM